MSMDRLIEFTSKEWNNEKMVIRYGRNKYILEIEKLPLLHRAQIIELGYTSDDYKLEGTAILSGKNKINYESIIIEFFKSDFPIKLINHKIRKTDYIEYLYAAHKNIKVQRNGFMVYCAPTGQGKTYFALSNLVHLSKQCDTILYINLELSIDDIANRCNSMGFGVPDNVYIAPMDNVKMIEQWSKKRGKIIFIIDNIDNLVGGGLDPFGEQLEFIKKLDRFLKDYNHHALVLTQLVKDNNLNLIGKDGHINDGITTNILSGVKQLSYLSRTVMMTAYSPELNNGAGAYDYKILKMGSANTNGS